MPGIKHLNGLGDGLKLLVVSHRDSRDRLSGGGALLECALHVCRNAGKEPAILHIGPKVSAKLSLQNVIRSRLWVSFSAEGLPNV